MSFGDTCDSVDMGLDDTVGSSNFLDDNFDANLDKVIFTATESGLVSS